MLPSHDISKPVLIGEIQDDGQFAIVEQTDLVDGEAWSPLLPESKNLVADWSEAVQCGAFDKVAKVCTTK